MIWDKIGAGFHGIVVSKSGVDHLMAISRHSVRHTELEEVLGTIAAADFGRSVRLRDGGAFLVLIKAGHVPIH